MALTYFSYLGMTRTALLQINQVCWVRLKSITPDIDVLPKQIFKNIVFAFVIRRYQSLHMGVVSVVSHMWVQ